MLRRLFWRFLFPGGVASALVWVAYLRLPVNPTSQAVWLLYPYLVLLLGGFYAFRFGRIRLLYLFALLGLLDYTATLPLRDAGERFLYWSVAALAPLNFALVAWMRERGLLSHAGILRLIFFVLQGGGVLWLVRTHPVTALAWLQRERLELIPSLVSFPQMVLLVMAFGVLLLLLRVLRQPGIFEVSLCWSFAALVAALLWPAQARILLSTSGLIVTLAVIEVTHFMAFRDELTGLPARRALSEYLARLSGRYTLVMADVDHFKKVNDTYGHDVGDQVLRMVASTLSRVAGGGRVFRYGGEEFTLVFAGKSLETALPHVEKVREQLAAAPFVMRRSSRKKKKPKKPQKDSQTALQFRVTASFGMAQRDDGGDTPGSVIKRADDALYRAKRGGRNRVCR